jgi:hypothetical protein
LKDDGNEEEDLDDDTYRQFSRMSVDDMTHQWTKWSNANPKSVTFGSSHSVPRLPVVTEDVVKSFGGGGGSPPRHQSSSKHHRPLSCVLPHVV